MDREYKNGVIIKTLTHWSWPLLPLFFVWLPGIGGNFQTIIVLSLFIFLPGYMIWCIFGLFYSTIILLTYKKTPILLANKKSQIIMPVALNILGLLFGLVVFIGVRSGLIPFHI